MDTDKPSQHRQRRGKRDAVSDHFKSHTFSSKSIDPSNNENNMSSKEEQVTKSSKPKPHHRTGKRKTTSSASGGGVEALIPSLIGVGILIFSVMAQQGFRGRSFVAGIDLGTTNSVVCVQAQSKSVGDIDCIQDPNTGSPIVPSVVSFLEQQDDDHAPTTTTRTSSLILSPKKEPSAMLPHPSQVLVGQSAKHRINSHPHLTVYHAKRVLGREFTDPAVPQLQDEVEFSIVRQEHSPEVAFRLGTHPKVVVVPPTQVGAYIVHHLIQMTRRFLGHDNIKSAVLAVPAKFNTLQRQRTMEAFTMAGIKVARVLEEPTAAALAYGLHKKDGVEKILVYDFGGGTLDVSILHVAEGYCEVMGSDGDDRLGGADFDAAVAHLFATEHSRVLQNLASYKMDAEDLSSACHEQVTEELPLCSISSFHTLGERLKISLSETGQTVHANCLALPPASSEWNSRTDSVDAICKTLYPVSLSLSLEKYNTAAEPLFQKSILPITRLLEDLTLEEKDIDEIVMVGGTTRMPQIRQLVANAFSIAQMNTHIDPDLTVAYGAASVID